MNLKKIKSVSFSLLKKETDIKDGKAEYLKKKTVKFILPNNFPKKEKMFELLIKNMYDDLMNNTHDEADSLGLWIEYDSFTIDNSITLNTLRSIKEYSKQDIDPIFEFFKMSLQK